MQSRPTDSYSRDLLDAGVAFNYWFFGDSKRTQDGSEQNIEGGGNGNPPTSKKKTDNRTKEQKDADAQVTLNNLLEINEALLEIRTLMIPLSEMKAMIKGGYNLLKSSPELFKAFLRSNSATKVSLKSFNKLDDLRPFFNDKSLTDLSPDLSKSGWQKLDGNWGTRTVFEKKIGNQRYYAQWEVNTVHSTNNKPVGYWKVTYGKINATKKNTFRVSPSQYFKE